MKLKKIALIALVITFGIGVLNFNRPFMAQTAAADAAETISTDKTATMVDQEKRIYDITMKAWSEQSLVPPMDIELVLDRSGSMGYGNRRLPVATHAAELGEDSDLNKSSYSSNGGDYSVCGYAWSEDGEDFRPVRYDTVSGTWQIFSRNQNEWNNNHDIPFRNQANRGDFPTPDESQFDGQTNVTSRGDYPIPRDGWTTFDTSQVTPDRPLYGYRWALLLKSVNMFLENIDNEIKNKSLNPDTRVHIIHFGGYYYEPAVNRVTPDFTQVTSANIQTINQNLSKVTSWGSTRTDEGLQQAAEDLNSDDGRKKVSILFTDGAPTSTNGYERRVADAALAAAGQIRSLPASMYAVGLFGVPDGEPYIEDGHNVESEFLIPAVGGTANQSNYQRVTATNPIENIFQNIAEWIVQGYTIRDYIDPHFIPIDENGNPSGENDDIVGTDHEGKRITGKLKQDTKGWYVEWSRQSIPSPVNKEGAWSVTFKVKAKDEYIGGPDVKTNLPPGNGSTGVYKENADGTPPEYTTGFPEPTVNVPIRFDVSNDSDSIWKGDPVPAANGAKTMFDPDAVQYGDIELNEELNNGTFSYAWYKSDGDGNPAGDPVSTDPDYTPPGKLGDDQYVLKVTYTPKKSDGSPSPDDAVTMTGVYNLTVKAGTLTLKKVVTGYPDHPEANPDAFTFHVSGPGLRTDVVLKDQDRHVLSQLPRGTYTISEIVPMEYTLAGYDLNHPDSEGTAGSAPSTITVKIGEGDGASKDLTVTCTNKFEHQGYFHSADSKDNVIRQPEETRSH